MNANTQFLQNRAQVDNAIQTLLLETREIVCELVKPLAAQGKFSLDNIPSDRRGRLRTVDDIAQTMDPTALLAVLMACLSNRSAQALHIPGVNFQLVDKVRRIRNEHAHGEGEADYNNINYVRDAVNATNDLRLGLLNARTSLSASQYKPSPNPRVGPTKAQPRPPIRQYNPYPRNPNPRVAPSKAQPRSPQPSKTVFRRKNYDLTSSHSEYTQAAKDNTLIISPDQVNAKGQQGTTPLHIAVRHNHPEIANALIVAGAEVNAKNDGGETPLHNAVRRRRTEMIKILIAAGWRSSHRAQ